MSNVSPLATPHLRTTVTALVPGSAASISVPAPPVAPTPATAPRLRSVSPGETPASAGHPGSDPAPVAAGGVFRLPANAVIAAWPQLALPEQLAAAFPGIETLAGADAPMVGYLVLVPAGAPLGGLDALAASSARPVPAGVPQAAAVAAHLPAEIHASAAAHASTAVRAAIPAQRPAPAPVPAPGHFSAPTRFPAPASTIAAEPPSAAQGGIQLDLERRTARVDGELLELTYLEFELLAHLTAHPHRVHTRDHLVTAVWGYGHVGDGRTVDVHVARLRRKLGVDYRQGIVTVRRVGYKYVPPKQG